MDVVTIIIQPLKNVNGGHSIRLIRACPALVDSFFFAVAFIFIRVYEKKDELS